MNVVTELLVPQEINRVPGSKISRFSKQAFLKDCGCKTQTTSNLLSFASCICYFATSFATCILLLSFATFHISLKELVKDGEGVN